MAAELEECPELFCSCVHLDVQEFHASEGVPFFLGVVGVAFHVFLVPSDGGVFDGVPETIDKVETLFLGIGDEVRFEDPKSGLVVTGNADGSLGHLVELAYGGGEDDCSNEA